MGHARCPAQSAAVTATWQLATLPRAPQYCRATPTEWSPDLGKLVSSSIGMPERAGVTARSRRGTPGRSEVVLRATLETGRFEFLDGV
jgi:hypothetical protein